MLARLNPDPDSEVPTTFGSFPLTRKLDIEDFLSQVRDTIRYAFQPIVSIHTGVAFGFEALLRDQEQIGFSSVRALLDYAFQSNLHVRLDQLLFDLSVTAFSDSALAKDARLFLNLDNRLLLSPDYAPEVKRSCLERKRLYPTSLCMEISEMDAVIEPDSVTQLIRTPAPGCLVAIDDFGIGHSGLRLLFESRPDLIKIDRFFISGIETEQTKKVFLSSIVNLAHVLGIPVIAEGVETEREFYVCREIGCDYVQGYFIERPRRDLEILSTRYPIVADTNRNDRRSRADHSTYVRSELDQLPPLGISAGMAAVLDAFRQDKTRSFFPVVDEAQHPLGIVLETDLKEFVYSLYGKEVLANPGTRHKLRAFITHCVVCEISTPIDQILATFAMRGDDPAMIIVDQGRYVGLLHARSMVRIMNERNLALARNQNPLTKLPGNTSISDYLVEAFEHEAVSWCFAYFDLDNFKSFNDLFGFRQGDRAITLFADLLRTHFKSPGFFLGHIGGDDFFMGISGQDTGALMGEIRHMLDRFEADAATFYDSSAREDGFVMAKNRDGEVRRTPLLSASCALMELPDGRRQATVDIVSAGLATLKKQAKQSATKLAFMRLE